LWKNLTSFMEKEKLIQFLQNMLPMPTDKAEQIAAYYHLKTLTKNEYLTQAGKICRQSFFVEEGFLRVYVTDVENNDVTLNFYGKDGFANDFLSFFKQIPASQNIQALTNCTVWAITFADLQTCFHTIPEFREFGRMLLVTNYGRLQERMLGMIQLTAEQRYVKLIESQPDIFQNAPLKMIATYLGITDTSLSRIRKEVSKK
jgi:CRP-like cAMP-binding protein